MTEHDQAGQSDEKPLKEELKQDAQSLQGSAKKQAEKTARQGRTQTVEAAQATSSALNTTADELQQDERVPDWLASAFRSASTQIQQVAGKLEGQEPREMMRTAEQFGREKPAMFLSAMGALGFAAGRYLRAGAEQHDDIDMVEPNASSRGSSTDTNEMSAYRSAGSPSSQQSDPLIATGGSIR